MTTETLTLKPLIILSADTVCSDLSNRAFRTWALICMLDDDAKSAFTVRRSALAAKLRVSISTIARALAELVAKGFLFIKPGQLQNAASVYEKKLEPEIAPKESSAVAFPTALLDQIASIRTTIPTINERSTAILNAIARFLPASVVDAGEPIAFIKLCPESTPQHPASRAFIPPPTERPIGPVGSPELTLESLEQKLKELLHRRPVALVEAYEVQKKILVLKRKLGLIA